MTARRQRCSQLGATFSSLLTVWATTTLLLVRVLSSRPVIFAYHGYPYLIHCLSWGYNEEGTTTTPFDMAVLNKLDRFHLAIDVIEWVPGLGSKAAHVNRDKLTASQLCGAARRRHARNPKLELDA